MRAGRVAGVAALVAVAAGAFLLWRSSVQSPRASPIPRAPARPTPPESAVPGALPASETDLAEPAVTEPSRSTHEGSAGLDAVEADAGSSAAVEATPSEDARRVRVEGTVEFSEGWTLQRSRIELRGADPDTRSIEHELPLALTRDGNPVRFRMPPLLPGEYHVTIDPQFVTAVTVPPQGTDLHFRVPPPGTLVVRVVDASSNAPIPRARLHWYAASDRGRFRLDSATRGTTPGEFGIVAPVGRVVLRADAEGYLETQIGERDNHGDWKGTVDVLAGRETAVTLRMERAGAARIVVRWEGHDAPRWDAVYLELVGRNAKDQECSYGLSIEEGGVGLREELPPGSYELRARRSMEVLFEPVPPRPLTVVAGETATLEITLVQKK